MIAVAIGVHIALAEFEHLAPDLVQADTPIRWLGILAEWGVVGGATVFTVFDLGKRVLSEVVSLIYIWRDRIKPDTTP